MISFLPIILGQGLPVHVEKVPILHSFSVSDGILTLGMKGSDENPSPTVGSSIAKQR